MCVYLQVVLWVPVRVKDDACVCCCKIDTQTTSSGTQEENKALRVGFTKTVYGRLAQVSTHTSIYPLIQVPIDGGRPTLKSYSKCFSNTLGN